MPARQDYSRDDFYQLGSDLDADKVSDYVVVENETPEAPKDFVDAIVQTSELVGKMELKCAQGDVNQCKYNNSFFSPLSLAIVANLIGSNVKLGSAFPDLDISTKIWLADSKDQRIFAAKAKNPALVPGKVEFASAKFSAGLIQGAFGAISQVEQDVSSWLGVGDFRFSSNKERKSVIAQKLNFRLNWLDQFQPYLGPNKLVRRAYQAKNLIYASGLFEIASNSFATGIRVPLQDNYIAEFYLLANYNSYSPVIPHGKLPNQWVLKDAQVITLPQIQANYAFSLDNISGLIKVDTRATMAQNITFQLGQDGISSRVATVSNLSPLSRNKASLEVSLEEAVYLFVWKRGIAVPVLIGTMAKQGNN